MMFYRRRNAAPAGATGPHRSLASDERGAVLVEFAIVAPAFFALLLATLYILLIYLAQHMLETAAESAGRLLLTGTAQSSTQASGNVGMTEAQFKNAICNGTTVTNAKGETVTIRKLLPPLLTCSNLTVHVNRVSAFNVNDTAAPTFTYNASGEITGTGTGYNYQSGGTGRNQIVVLQLIYLWPTGKGPSGLNLINQPKSNRMLVATSVFTTEDYSCAGSQTSC